MLVVTKIGTADNELPTCCNQRLSGSLLLLLLLVLVCPRIRAGADVTIMGGWTPPLIAPLVGFNGKGNQGRMKTEYDCGCFSWQAGLELTHQEPLPPNDVWQVQ